MPLIARRIAGSDGLAALSFQGLGLDVAQVGDFNGDGFDDFVLSDPYARLPGDSAPVATTTYAPVAPGTGAYTRTLAAEAPSYTGHSGGNYTRNITTVIAPTGLETGAAALIFGGPRGREPIMDLRALTPAQGFLIADPGATAADMAEHLDLGRAVAGIGDVNGDGFGDLLIGDPQGSGEVYTRAVEGESFAYLGTGGGSYTYSAALGTYVAAAGGDFARIEGGALSYGNESGLAHVIFGSAAPATDARNVLDLGAAGFAGTTIAGPTRFSATGAEVTEVGDVNGDGLDDFGILIPLDAYSRPVSGSYSRPVFNAVGSGRGSYTRTPDGSFTYDYSGSYSFAGSYAVTYRDDGTYTVTRLVILPGDAGGLPPRIDLSAPPAGTVSLSGLGGSARMDGGIDFDGDGFDDVIVGIGGHQVAAGTYSGVDDGAGLSGKPEAGEVLVFLGRDPSGTDGRIAAETLSDDGGLIFRGRSAGDHAGASVAAIGDFDGDGYGDFLIGAPGAETPGHAAATRMRSVTRTTYAPAMEGGGSYTRTGVGSYTRSGNTFAAAPQGLFEIVQDSYGRHYSYAGTTYRPRAGGDFVRTVITGTETYQAAPPTGQAYVLLGRTAPPAGVIGPEDSTSALGFQIGSRGMTAALGQTVAALGDVNGDGYDDIGIVHEAIRTIDAGGAGPTEYREPVLSILFGGAEARGSTLHIEDVGPSGPIPGVMLTGLAPGVPVGDGAAGDHGIGWSSIDGRDIDGDGYSDILLGHGGGPPEGGSGGSGPLILFGGGTERFAALEQIAAEAPIFEAAPVFLGDTGADRDIGTEGDDRLFGLSGDDELEGRAGDDTLDGGPDTDTAIFGGRHADYAIAQDAQGRVTVVDLNAADGDDGTDTLSGIERLRFSDREVAPPGTDQTAGAAIDLTGGGTSEILMRRADNGSAGYWDMESGSAVFVGLGRPGISYKVHGIGDYTSDAQDEILWRDGTSGSVGFWDLSSGAPDWTGLGKPGDFRIIGSGDFDGNGQDEILLRETATGVTGYWDFASGGTVWRGLGKPTLAWSVEGIGDYTGDGRADILWRESGTQTTGFWDISSGAPVWTGLGRPGASFQVRGSGDLNGDGVDDILFRETISGAAGYWDVSSGNPAWTRLGQSPTSWRIEGVGDFNGNGFEDVLWRDTASRTTGYWDMEDGRSWTGLGRPGDGWEIVGQGPDDFIF